MKRKKSPKSSASVATPEIQQIEQLLHFMEEHNLEEFEYSRGDLHIRLKKPSSRVVVQTAPVVQAPEIIVAGNIAPPQATSSTATPSSLAEGRGSEELHLIKSPIVGTYYGSPSPGAEAFVKVGQYIETGQTLCIVEAMKLMNEIESDTSGEVVRIFSENGQPVEYGQPLFGVRPSRKK
jgi:acetyl-CoA carboxylase biotin carboxyl carrier protein